MQISKLPVRQHPQETPLVKNIGVEGRLVRDGVRKPLANRRRVIEDLVKAIGKCRKSGGGLSSGSCAQQGA
jgi:hypothetical protein